MEAPGGKAPQHRSQLLQAQCILQETGSCVSSRVMRGSGRSTSCWLLQLQGPLVVHNCQFERQPFTLHPQPSPAASAPALPPYPTLATVR